MTSNPTIFEPAIGGTADYDDELTTLASSPKTDREVFETRAIEDVCEAADRFRPVIEKFIRSFDAVLDLIAKKRKRFCNDDVKQRSISVDRNHLDQR